MPWPVGSDGQRLVLGTDERRAQVCWGEGVRAVQIVVLVVQEEVIYG